MEDEDGGLQLLQIRGSGATKKICPVPGTDEYVPMAKFCPEDLSEQQHDTFSTCIEQNRHFTTFHNAWEKCGLTPDCGAVMLWTDGLFYLRRATDPDSLNPIGSVKLYRYECQEAEFENQQLDKLADEKAEELVRQARRLEREKQQEFVHKLRHHLENEVQDVKDHAAVTEQEEKEYVSRIETKTATMQETVKEIADATSKVSEDAKKAHHRLTRARYADQEAQILKDQADNLKWTKEEAVQKVREAKELVAATNVQFQKISEEAAQQAKHLEEVQAHINEISNVAFQKVSEVHVKVKEAEETKAELQKKVTSVREKKEEVLKKLEETQRKQKEGEEELHKVEEQLKQR